MDRPREENPLLPFPTFEGIREPCERVTCRCGATLGEVQTGSGEEVFALGGVFVLAPDLLPLPRHGGLPRYGLSRRVKQKGPLQPRRRPVERKTPVRLRVPVHVRVYCPSCGKGWRIKVRRRPLLAPREALLSPRAASEPWWEIEVAP